MYYFLSVSYGAGTIATQSGYVTLTCTPKFDDPFFLDFQQLRLFTERI